MRLYNKQIIASESNIFLFKLQKMMFDCYKLNALIITSPGSLSEVIDCSKDYILLILVDRVVIQEEDFITERALFINKVTKIRWKRSFPVKIEYNLEYSSQGIEDRECCIIDDYGKTWILLEEDVFNEFS